MPGPPSVEVAEVGRVYARIYGFSHDGWDGGAAPPITEQNKVEALITKLPFAIGRVIGGDEDVPADPSHWLRVDNTKVSKKHALITFDEDAQTFRLKVFGRNGVDVNRVHLKLDEEAELPSKSAIRIGPLYAYFVLPSKSLQPLPATTATASASTSNASRLKRTAPTVYKKAVDDAYGKHFANFGYFTVLDMIKVLQNDVESSTIGGGGSSSGAGGGGLEYVYQEIRDSDETKLRDAIKRYLNRPESGYESVDHTQVPASVLEKFTRMHTRKQMQYWKRQDPETHARKLEELRLAQTARQKLSSATVGGGGGGGGSTTTSAVGRTTSTTTTSGGGAGGGGISSDNDMA